MYGGQSHPPLRGPPSLTKGGLALVHRSFFVLLTERELLSGVRVCLRAVFTPSTMRPWRTVPLPLQEVEAYPCAALIFCFTIREALLNDAKENVGAQTGGSH